MSKNKTGERSGKIRVLVLKEPYWGKQVGETDQQFAAFQIARDMPVQERSHAAVARKCGKSEALINSWAKQNKWAVRLEAWDLHKDAERLDHLRKEQEEANLPLQMVRPEMVREALLRDAIQECVDGIERKRNSSNAAELKLWREFYIKEVSACFGIPAEEIEASLTQTESKGTDLRGQNIESVRSSIANKVKDLIAKLNTQINDARTYGLSVRIYQNGVLGGLVGSEITRNY